MLGMSRVKLAQLWMTSIVEMWSYSLKLSLWPNCTPRYLMLLLHAISCSPSIILRYLKDLWSVSSNASVFSRDISRLLLSNQRFTRHRLWLILSPWFPTSSAAHTTSTLSVKPKMLLPTGRYMRRKSSYMTFHTSGPSRNPWRALHVICSLRNHLLPSYITYLLII